MNNKLNNQKQKKVINTEAERSDKIHKYIANVMQKAKKDLGKIEAEIEVLEKTNN